MAVEEDKELFKGQITLKELIKRPYISHEELGKKFEKILTAPIEKITELKGIAEPVRDTGCSLCAGHNLILVGGVGVGKTTLLKEIAKYSNVPYSRTNGSEYIEESDIIGFVDIISAKQFGYNHPLSFNAGGVIGSYGGIWHIDEINRLSERSQNILLSIMEENTAVLRTWQVNTGCIVVGTMNPSEFVGTSELTEALKDRADFILMPQVTDVSILMEILKVNTNKFKTILVPDKVYQLVAIITSELQQRVPESLELAGSVRKAKNTINRAIRFSYLRKAKEVSFKDVEKAMEATFLGSITPTLEVETEITTTLAKSKSQLGYKTIERKILKEVFNVAKKSVSTGYKEEKVETQP